MSAPDRMMARGANAIMKGAKEEERGEGGSQGGINEWCGF